MTQLIAGGESAIAVEPYDESHEASHAQFAERMWPAKRRRREPQYIRWKFRGPAHGPVPGLLLALSGGEVIGQLGLIPATIRADGTSLACQWACDLMVDSSLRRRGIGSMLFAAAMARELVTLGSNPSAAADVTMKRLGFRPLRGPMIAVLPIDPVHVLSWKIPPRYPRTTAIAAAALRPLMVWRARRIRETIGATSLSVEHGDWRLVTRDVTRAQARSAKPYIVHDDSFLAWRCEGLSGYAEPLTALRTPAGSYAIV